VKKKTLGADLKDKERKENQLSKENRLKIRSGASKIGKAFCTRGKDFTEKRRKLIPIPKN